MITSYFSTNQIIGLVCVVLIHLISIYYFTFKRNIKWALLSLFVGGVILRLIFINFDSYLHTWDEQYHALVAKNMAEHPLLPMLFKNTPLPYDINNWSGNQIWLHKQPVFLWQMALSIKAFGATVFAVRLPSAIMSALLILIIFRIGKLTINEQVGYIASLLYAACNYLLDFNTGNYATDHNDVAFIFYVTLSIWAYSEYHIGNKTKYIWLIGLFAGLAVLNKWMVGLTVFSGWGISLFFIKGMAPKWAEFKNIVKAYIICLHIVIPWQIYILAAFPKESIYEYSFSGKHLFEAIEGHTGDNWYYFDQAIEQYGQIATYILPIALIILFIDIKNIPIRISYITYVVAIYLFFTIAKTKMIAFCLIVSPILFLALGNLLYRIFNYLHRIKINNYFLKSAEFVSLAAISLISLDIEKIQLNHTAWVRNDYKASLIKATTLAKSIAGKYPPEKTVVVNCNSTENIPFMFFTGYTAYDRVPSLEEYAILKKENFNILFINNFCPIPDYLKNDKKVIFIDNCIGNKTVSIKTINNKYLCDDEKLNHILVANRNAAGEWETFLLILFENNECAIRTYNNKFLSAELNHKTEITATRTAISSWETFTIINLPNDYVAFKAANNKYLSLDEKSLQLFAKGNTIGDKEKFKLIPIKDK